MCTIGKISADFNNTWLPYLRHWSNFISDRLGDLKLRRGRRKVVFGDKCLFFVMNTSELSANLKKMHKTKHEKAAFITENFVVTSKPGKDAKTSSHRRKVCSSSLEQRSWRCFVVLVTVADGVVLVNVTELGEGPHHDERELAKSASTGTIW